MDKPRILSTDPEFEPEAEFERMIAEFLALKPRTHADYEAILDRHFEPISQLGFLREMVWQSSDAICVTDSRGRLTIVNPAFCSLVGQDMGDLVGTRVQKALNVDLHAFDAIEEQLRQGVRQADYEYIFRRPGETPRVLSISMTPLRNPERGNYTQTVHVARDVTGRRELERQIVEWQQRARQYLYALHPPEIAEAMVEGRVEARNLPASVIFTDITGFTQFTTQVAPDEVAQALHRYFTAMTQVVLDHHGWVDKFVGDSIMALFGVPGGAPDHAQRAVDAAAAMMSRMTELDLPWRHKVGIASGQVIAGDIGSQQKPTYTAIGDPVNLASRLKDMARPGEVLLCSRTHADAGTERRYDALGSLDVRGYGASEVYRLLV